MYVLIMKIIYWLMRYWVIHQNSKINNYQIIIEICICNISKKAMLRRIARYIFVNWRIFCFDGHPCVDKQVYGITPPLFHTKINTLVSVGYGSNCTRIFFKPILRNNILKQFLWNCSLLCVTECHSGSIEINQTSGYRNEINNLLQRFDTTILSHKIISLLFAPLTNLSLFWEQHIRSNTFSIWFDVFM